MKAKRKQAGRLIFLLALAYFISYLTRVNYAGIVAEMEQSTGFSRTLLSMALTGSFITYGVGQVISGVVGDHVSPKKMIAIGLGVTACANLLIPFCPDPYWMTAVWCVNGFAQSMMWPPIVRIMSEQLTPEEYEIGTVRVSWGGSGGSIAVYLLSPLLISLAGWKSVFFVSAAAAILMIPVWLRFVPDSDPAAPAAKEIPEPERPFAERSRRTFLTPLMLFIMLAIALQGGLRDGVTTWTPTYISQTYRLGSAVSILTGVVSPVFSILSLYLAEKLYRRYFSNPVSCAAALFLAGLIAAGALFLSSGKSPVISLVCIALLTGSMHGVNMMLICMIPPYFNGQGKISTVAGVLNACTYIGSAVSGYGIAALSEQMGWNATLLIWAGIAAAGAVICLLCLPGWRRRFPQGKNHFA